MSTAVAPDMERELADMPYPVLEAPLSRARPRAAFLRRLVARLNSSGLRPDAAAWVWCGVLLTAVGFVLIAIGWAQVAGEVDVYRQLPYVVSAGFVGLGLVICGVGVLGVATRRRDATAHDLRMAHLVALLEELRQAFDRDEGRS